jgi:hypothetical protein
MLDSKVLILASLFSKLDISSFLSKVIVDIKLGARDIVTIENKSNTRAIILCAGVN